MGLSTNVPPYSKVEDRGPNPLCALSFLLGVSLIFVNPVRGLWLEWLYVPVAAGYTVSPFEILSPLVCVLVLLAKGFEIRRSELWLIFAVGLILSTRVLSTYLAEESTPDQFLSLLRYGGVAFLMFGSAGLFSQRSCRTAFVTGAMIAGLTEALGSIAITMLSRGEERGILVSEGSYVVETYVAVFCLIVAVRRANLFLPAGGALIVLTTGIFMSLTRTGMILLLLSMVVGICYLAYAQRGSQKPFLAIALALSCLMVLVCLVGYVVLPRMGEVVEQRVLAALQGEGSVLERFFLWDRALAAFIEHPITGIGSGGFARQLTALPNVFGIQSPIQYSDIDELPGVHNTVLGVASETGVIGLSAYLVWFVTILGLSFRTLRMGQFTGDVAPVAAAILLLTLIASDFWAIGSFLPSFSIYAGLTLGWSREMTKHINQTRS